MTDLRTYRFTLGKRYKVLLFIAILCTTNNLSPIFAQEHQKNVDSTLVQQVVNQLVKKEKKPKAISSVTVTADLVGPVMMALKSDWYQLEASARIGMYDRFFPIVELGWGVSSREGEEINNHYKVSAPYFRVGCDYNFIHKKSTGYRLLAGLRYGFSSYKYDFYSDDPLIDPVWKEATVVDLREMKGNTHWAEVVIGLEAKLWKFIHLGWDMRFKFRIHHGVSTYGTPWYTPGFGTEPETVGWGGTFKLMFEI